MESPARPDTDRNLDLSILDGFGVERLVFDVYVSDTGEVIGCTVLEPASNGVTAAALFVPQSGNVTDLRYLSVRGKAELISGTDTGTVSQIQINPISGLSVRRLNWRELQIVK